MISECIMVFLLFMLANGWMTVWTAYDFDEGMEFHIPIFMLVFMAHLMLVFLALVDRNAHHKFHDFAGWTGLALALIKMMLVAVFFYLRHYCLPTVKKAQRPFYD